MQDGNVSCVTCRSAAASGFLAEERSVKRAFLAGGAANGGRGNSALFLLSLYCPTLFLRREGAQKKENSCTNSRQSKLVPTVHAALNACELVRCA